MLGISSRDQLTGTNSSGKNEHPPRIFEFPYFVPLSKSSTFYFSPTVSPAEPRSAAATDKIGFESTGGPQTREIRPETY